MDFPRWLARGFDLAIGPPSGTIVFVTIPNGASRARAKAISRYRLQATPVLRLRMSRPSLGRAAAVVTPV
jgi:hypothetical protein